MHLQMMVILRSEERQLKAQIKLDAIRAASIAAAEEAALALIVPDETEDDVEDNIDDIIEFAINFDEDEEGYEDENDQKITSSFLLVSFKIKYFNFNQVIICSPLI